MATIAQAQERLAAFASGLAPMLEEEISRNGDFFERAVREQLESGLDGDEKELRPNYLSDPYFKTRAAAVAYMRWKERITPPRQSSLGLRPRPAKVPNLRITGFYHMSIRALPVEGGVRIASGGVDFAKGIEQKYGSGIYKVGRTARRQFFQKHVRKALRSYYKRHGLA